MGEKPVSSQRQLRCPHRRDGSPTHITATSATEQQVGFTKLLYSALSLFQYFNPVHEYLVFLGLQLQETVL